MWRGRLRETTEASGWFRFPVSCELKQRSPLLCVWTQPSPAVQTPRGRSSFKFSQHRGTQSPFVLTSFSYSLHTHLSQAFSSHRQDSSRLHPKGFFFSFHLKVLCACKNPTVFRFKKGKVDAFIYSLILIVLRCSIGNPGEHSSGGVCGWLPTGYAPQGALLTVWSMPEALPGAA